MLLQNTMLYLKLTLVNAYSALARSLWPPPFHLVSKKYYLWEKEEPKVTNSKNIYWHEIPANLPLAVYDLLYMGWTWTRFLPSYTACIPGSYIPAYIRKLIRPYIPLRSATSVAWRLPPCHTLSVHDCCLFWPHGGGMTLLWTSEHSLWPLSNADWELTSSRLHLFPSLLHRYD